MDKRLAWHIKGLPVCLRKSPPDPRTHSCLAGYSQDDFCLPWSKGGRCWKLYPQCHTSLSLFGARTRRVRILQPLLPQTASFDCSFSPSAGPLLARHDGNGMQTVALIMTFTVYTLHYSLVWGKAPRRGHYNIAPEEKRDITWGDFKRDLCVKVKPAVQAQAKVPSHTKLNNTGQCEAEVIIKLYVNCTYTSVFPRSFL